MKNTGWLLFDKILRLGVGLVVGVWVVRFLGPDRFGVFSFAFAFATLFSVFVSLGLDGVVVRELVSAPQEKNSILGAAFTLKLVGGIFALIVSLLAIYFLRPADFQVRAMVGIIAVGMIFQSLDVIDFWLQSQIEARVAVYARSIAFLLVSGLKVFLILTNAPLIAFAWAASLELALAGIGLVLVYRYTGHHILEWRPDSSRVRQLLGDSWPLALSSVAIIIYMKIDQIMLGEMLDSTAVGVYSAAVRISEVWYFIPAAIVASVSPSLFEASRTSQVIFDQRLEKLFRTVSLTALAIAVPMTFLSNFATRALYGNAYTGAGQILAIHIWAALFVFMGVAQNPWTIIEGQTKFALVKTTIGAASNVILNLLLIPRYAGIGAAVATTVSYALASFLLNVFNARSRKLFYLQLWSLLPIFQTRN